MGDSQGESWRLNTCIGVNWGERELLHGGEVVMEGGRNMVANWSIDTNWLLAIYDWSFWYKRKGCIIKLCHGIVGWFVVE